MMSLEWTKLDLSKLVYTLSVMSSSLFMIKFRSIGAYSRWRDFWKFWESTILFRNHNPINMKHETGEYRSLLNTYDQKRVSWSSRRNTLHGCKFPAFWVVHTRAHYWSLQSASISWRRGPHIPADHQSHRCMNLSPLLRTRRRSSLIYWNNLIPCRRTSPRVRRF